MATKFASLLQRIIGSRMGWLLVLVHFCLVVYDFAMQETIPTDTSRDSFIVGAGTSIIAGRSIHFSYESLLLQTIFLLDLPGLLVISLIWLPFSALAIQLFPQPSLYTESWIGAIILLLGTSVQWLLVGYGIETLLRKKRNKPDSKLDA